MPVWITIQDRQPKRIAPRELNERTAEEESVVDGYFMPDPQQSFDPDDIERYPDDWIETSRDGTQRLRLPSDNQGEKRATIRMRMAPGGRLTEGGRSPTEVRLPVFPRGQTRSGGRSG